MIIVLLADGFEEIEALTPVDMLRRAGLEVKTVGISGKAPTGAHGIAVVCDASPDEIDLSKVTMAIFPGGMPGATNLDKSDYTDKVIAAVIENGGHLAAICAAPLIFGRRGLLIGKGATCYPGFEKELKGASVTDCGCITDGNITTAKAMGSALDFAEELIRIAKGQQVADQVSSAIYRSEKIALKAEKEEKPTKALTLDEFLAQIEADVEPEEEAVEKIDFTSPDYSGYALPPIDLLTPDKDADSGSYDDEIKDTSEKIISILAQFGVNAEIVGAERGPRLTRFELIPNKGGSVAKILKLADDVALMLGVESIRAYAPIPGKNAIGFEIPNKNGFYVSLRGLIDCEEFKSSGSLTTACIGKDVVGKPVLYNLESMPHLLIGGSTGMGKSVLINSLLVSLLYKARPDQVKLILIDPKQVEFSYFKNIPHLLMPIIYDAKESVAALKWAIEEMDRRYALFMNASVRSLERYNSNVAEGDALPRIFIVIDEFADLMLQVKDPIESLVMRIAQKARAAGIHLIIGTQRPSPSVITGVIKANIPSRISCKVSSQVDSKVMLDMGGAERLLGKGDALFLPVSSPSPRRVQCAYESDSSIEALTDYIKEKGGEAVYDPNILAYIEREAKKLADRPRVRECEDEESLYDSRFFDAVDIAIEYGKISTSLIQRKLSIGYGRAAKYIDMMEELKIITSPNGVRPRQVIMSKEDWEALRTQLKDN